MIKHYFTVAFRNLLRYRTQTLISIIGLTVGLTCFSLSLFWLEYEKSYDNFHSKADRIYSVQYTDSTKVEGLSPTTPYPLARYLKETYPEIEESTTVRSTGYAGFVTNVGTKMEWVTGISIDSTFCKIFDLSDKNLSFEYYPYDENYKPKKRIPTAITRSAAKKFFGDELALGKEIVPDFTENTYVVEKIIDEWPLNTNIRFDIIVPIAEREEWNVYMCNTFILLKENTNADELKKKLLDFDKDKFSMGHTGITIISIKELNVVAPNRMGVVKYNYIYLFSISGLLVALCALFNYLMLFVNRIRMRNREFALRKVNGASTRSLLSLLYCEYCLILLATLVLGYLFICAVLPEFKKISALVNVPDLQIYLRTFVYLLLFFFSIMLLSIIPIYYFQHKSLQSGIQKESAHTGKNMFYKVCVLLQIIISIGFIFCTTVLAKQINHFNKLDLGFNRERIAQFEFDWYKHIDNKPYADKVKQLASVEDVLKYESTVLWSRGKQFSAISEWEDNVNQSRIEYEIFDITPQFIDFFDMKIVKGRNFEENNFDESEYIINETMAKAFGWEDPIGKQFDCRGDRCAKIIGVVKDFNVDNPELPVHAVAMKRSNEFRNFSYKYKEGYKKQTEDQIKDIIWQDHPGEEIRFEYMEEYYEDLFRSENTLLKLLAATTIVCIIISVFGIYSVVTLICTKRRKEIAIRKANGASVWNILSGLLKEYVVLLVIGAVIIFPIVTAIMKMWIEHYLNRTTIDWWIYVAIFIGVLLAVTFSVFTQVWRAANTNPAEVLKSE